MSTWQQSLPLQRGGGTVFAQFDTEIDIRSYGNIFDYNPQDIDLSPQIRALNTLMRPPASDAWCVLWQRLANNQWPGRRFKVEMFESTPMHHERFITVHNKRADGVLITKRGDAVAMTSRDCPILVLYRRSGGPVAVLHCSRSSLTGIDLGDEGRSVIHEAFAKLGSDFGHASDVYGFLTMGIAAKHFNNERYPVVIADLAHRYGPSVINGSEGRPTIDLVALVRAQVAEHGMDPERIIHDGLDTFTDERLASVRAQRGGHNLVTVVRR